MFSSWGAAKAPPSTSAARIPAPPPPTRQSRIRELWAGFEQWHAQAKGAADAKRVEAYKTLDKSHKSNKKNKASKAEHEKAKEQKAKQDSWKKFTTKSAKKGIEIAGVTGRSIFKTPDNPLGKGECRRSDAWCSLSTLTDFYF